MSFSLLPFITNLSEYARYKHHLESPPPVQCSFLSLAAAAAKVST